MAARAWERPGAPLASVLVPAWRAGDVLGRALASLAAQTVAEWEAVVVVDGPGEGAEDATLEAARAWAGRDRRVRVLAHERRRGAAAARNTALAAARGRWIAFLDADDEWLPPKLERQLAHMRREGAAFGYTGFWRVPPSGRARAVAVPAWATRERLLGGNVIGCLTACYDRAALGDRPMPDLPMRHDFALWLEILRDVPCAHGLPEPLARHHVRAGSLSSGRLRAARATWAVYRREGIAPPRAAWLLGRHLAGRMMRG